MKKLISLLLSLLLLATAAGCGVQSEPEDVPAMPTLTTPPGGTGSGDENSSEPSPYLRLYCPADLSDKNKSAGGGDAIVGLPIPWEEINAGDRGGSSRRSTLWSCCWASAPPRTSSTPYRRGRSF